MIVVVSGKMGSGKTALTKQLQAAIPNSHTVKFAAPLYEAVEAALNVLVGYGLQPRNKDGPFLQWLGKHIRDTETKSFWVDIGKKRADGFEEQSRPSSPVLVLIDDCRFENEFVPFMGALKIRLECDRDTRKARADNWRENEFHDSEVGLDEYSRSGKFDFYIDTGKVNAEDTFLSVRTMMHEWDRFGKVPHKGDYNDLSKRGDFGWSKLGHLLEDKSVSTR